MYTYKCYILLALHIAIQEGHKELVKFLISNGIKLNLKERKNGFTPLMQCIAQQPLHFDEIFESLLEAKPDINIQDSQGQTALHLTLRALHIWCNAVRIIYHVCV